MISIEIVHSRNQVFWDAGTLYVLRGVLKGGWLDKAITKLSAFSEKRLLGDHVPYVIEAYPYYLRRSGFRR